MLSICGSSCKAALNSGIARPVSDLSSESATLELVASTFTSDAIAFRSAARRTERDCIAGECACDQLERGRFGREVGDRPRDSAVQGGFAGTAADGQHLCRLREWRMAAGAADQI